MVNAARPNAGRRNVVMAAATGIIAGLLFVYPTSLGHATGGSVVSQPAIVSETSPGTTSSAASSSAGSSSSSGSSSKSGSAAATSGTKTVTGSAVNTRYGPVQVQLTVTDGKIVTAQAIEYPSNNGRDQEINSYAVPQLNSEVLAAQSASIDTVSGATYTSNGYLKSLQSALDAAHLA